MTWESGFVSTAVDEYLGLSGAEQDVTIVSIERGYSSNRDGGQEFPGFWVDFSDLTRVHISMFEGFHNEFQMNMRNDASVYAVRLDRCGRVLGYGG